jgi:hypothetical protein
MRSMAGRNGPTKGDELADAQLRRDVDAYARRPLSVEELAVADLTVKLNLDDAQVDYDALYGGQPPS